MNVYGTDCCPTGRLCEICGAPGDDLRVAAVDLEPIGVGCLTLCPVCRSAQEPPPVGVGTANRLVLTHCMHLRIDVDQMVALLEPR